MILERKETERETSLDFVEPSEAELHKPWEWNETLWYWCGPETGGKRKGQYLAYQPSKFKVTAHNSKKQKVDVSKNNLGNRVTINEAA